VLGHWNFPSQLREGKTPQTLPSVETKQKEYGRRLTRTAPYYSSRISNYNVLAHFSSIRVFTVVHWPCRAATSGRFTTTAANAKPRISPHTLGFFRWPSVAPEAFPNPKPFRLVIALSFCRLGQIRVPCRVASIFTSSGSTYFPYD